MAHSRLLPLLALGSLLFFGCQSSGDVSVLVPLSDGTKMRVLMSGRGPDPAKNEAVQVLNAGFTLKRDIPALQYEFEFKPLQPLTPRRVTIEDVASEKPIVLLRDEAPQLIDGRWSGRSTPFGLDAPELAWLLTIQNSIRVYRFTVETTEGKTWVLDQASPVPAFAKQALRQSLGAKY